MNQQFPLNPKWINCKGSSEFYRGYPCSMWLLYHSMLVICKEKTENIEYDAISVLLTIKDYMENFFQCEYCRQHFLHMTANVTNEIHTNTDAILYLWNKHNVVNSRLRHDDSADPEHPKVQFPSKSSCSKCYNTTNLKQDEIFISNPGFNTPSISWNKKMVESFLLFHYSGENIRIKHSDDENEKNNESFDVDKVKYKLKLNKRNIKTNNNNYLKQIYSYNSNIYLKCLLIVIVLLLIKKLFYRNLKALCYQCYLKFYVKFAKY